MTIQYFPEVYILRSINLGKKEINPVENNIYSILDIKIIKYEAAFKSMMEESTLAKYIY